MQTIKERIPYESSRLGKNYCMAYLLTFRNMLDFSSLSRTSLLYKIAADDPVCLMLLSVLGSLRKNSSFYWKDELSNRFPSRFYAVSPKQYSIKMYDDLYLEPRPVTRPRPELSIVTRTPFLPHSVCELDVCGKDLNADGGRTEIVKCKGLKRSLAKLVLGPQNTDFERVAERCCPSRRVLQHAIRKVNQKIFVVGSERRVLTRYCSKQYFNSKYSTERFFFGFPLYLKSLLES